MILLYRTLLCLWAACLLAAPALHAQEFPELTGRVVDEADLLDANQEAALTQKLAALEAQSQRQLVVVTLDDLHGYDIADYGFRLGDHWGIGDKERDDGALLIVAPNERRVRIEVGYGLESVMPDILAGRIIRDTIVPRFKANDYPGGIAAGVEAIGELLTLPPEQAQQVVARAREAEAQRGSSNGEVVFAIFFILFFFVLPMLRRGHRGRAYRRGMAPVILWGPTIGGSSHRGGGGWSGGGFSGGGGGFGGGGASGGW